MSENTLNNLFEKARNEAPETSVQEIQKWIGYATLGTLLLGLFTKFKVVFTSKLGIMFYSTLVATGLGIGAFFMFGGNGNNQQNGALLAKDSYPNNALKTITLVDSQGRVLPKDPLKSNDTSARFPNAPNVSGPPNLGAVPPALPAPSLPEMPMRRMFDNIDKSAHLAKFDDKEYGEFTSISTSGIANVLLKQGSKCDVVVQADEKGKEVLTVKNQGGTLHIGIDTKGKSYHDINVLVIVTVKDLKSIHCSGATELIGEGTIKSDNLKITTQGATELKIDLQTETLKMDLSGASELNVNLETTNLYIDASGASEVELKGTSKNMELDCSGATELQSYELTVKNAVVDCSGASDLKINVSDTLDVEVSGASDVKCKGKPSITNQEVSGVSSFKRV